MKLDGRFEPLTAIAQVLALGGVILTAAISWIRHERPTAPPAPTFRETKTVETPWRYACRP